MFFVEDIPCLDRLIKPFHPVHARSFFYKGLSRFKKEISQDWVTGAFFLIKNDVFKKAGCFDEDYFMYTEEVDLCFRIKKLGYDVFYLPKWEIIHLGGASSTKEFPILSEYKGMKLFYQKNMPLWQYPFLRLFMKSGAFLRALIFGLIEGKEAHRVYVKAFKIA
jgi:GT2 family glycosyltransferase